MPSYNLNGRFLSQPLTGVQRYASEVLRAVSGRPKTTIDLHLPFLVSYTQDSGGNVRVVADSRFKGQLWEQLVLGVSRRRGVLLNLCNTYPVLARRQIVVVHDASVYAVPDGYTRVFTGFYRLLFWLLRFKRSTRIVTDSEFSRGELVRYAGLPAERITVVYCGADHWERISPEHGILDRLGLGSGRPFVLAVASDNPNKNLPRLVAAFRTLQRKDLCLVLVGGCNSRVFSQSDLATAENIIRAGYLTDAELAALYGAATCFVFPSLYEGFGLPPLEAMSFGCPVLVSREASLPEVCGDAALYCDGYDVTDIAAGIAKLVDTPELRAELSAAGRQRAARFRWRDTADALLKIADELA